MRKLFAAVAVLCFAALSFGQTATITGHLITPQNGASSSGVSILFELTNDNGQQCRLAGTGIIVPYQQTFTQAQLAAGVPLIPNNTLTCGTTTGASRWRYTVKSGGTGTRQCSLNITGNVNLDNAVCLNATSTPVTAATPDSIYARVDGSNVNWGGNTTHNGHDETNIGTIGLTEEAAPAGSAGNDLLYGDSSLHRPRFINNNGSGATVALLTDSIGSFTGTLTSAQLAAVVTDETGAAGGGVLVFNNAPAITNAALTTPIIGSAGATFNGSSSGTLVVKAAAVSGSSVATFPNGSGTVIEDGLVQTLSNKTFTGAATGNNLTILNAQGAVGPVTGTSGDAVLYTYTLPANTIDTNTKSLSVRCSATHTTGTANTTLKVNVNGVNITSLASGTTASQSTSMDVEILRTGTTTAGTSGIVAAATGTSGAFSISATGLAWTSSQVVTCTFNVAATDTWSGVMFVVKQNQ